MVVGRLSQSDGQLAAITCSRTHAVIVSRRVGDQLRLGGRGATIFGDKKAANT
jgi:hypothetical protein